MERHYEDGCICSFDEQGEVLVETTYVTKTDGEVDIDYTYVKPALRGRGIAGEMMRVVACHLRKQGLRAAASCSYARRWLDEHRSLWGYYRLAGRKWF